MPKGNVLCEWVDGWMDGCDCTAELNEHIYSSLCAAATTTAVVDALAQAPRPKEKMMMDFERLYMTSDTAPQPHGAASPQYSTTVHTVLKAKTKAHCC